MTAMAIKQQAIGAIQRLPKMADREEIMYRLYVLESMALIIVPATRGAGLQPAKRARGPSPRVVAETMTKAESIQRGREDTAAGDTTPTAEAGWI